MTDIERTIKDLQRAAKRLKGHQEEVLFPPWDRACVQDDWHVIRDAAWSVISRTNSFSKGVAVSLNDLGALIHYIADMME